MIYKGRDELEEELLHILDDDIFLPDQYRQERIDEILIEIARIDDMYYSYYNKGENDKRTIEVWKIISLLLALIFGGRFAGHAFKSIVDKCKLGMCLFIIKSI